MRPIARRPFLQFLALSVAIHAVLMGDWLSLSARDEQADATVLTAELVTLPPAQTAPTAAVMKPAPAKPAPRPDQRVRAAPLPPEPAAITVPQPASSEEPEIAAMPETEVAEAPEPTPEAAAAAPDASTEVAPPVARIPQAIQPVRDLPPTGSQSYELFYGVARLHIGRTLQTWSFDDHTYRISSSSETTGLAGFLRPYQLDYVSEGRIDASGFQPESFFVRRGRNGARQYAARFDWGAKALTLGPVAAPRTVALPEGTLDVLSLIYQLRRAQLAPGRFQLSITTGSRLETYTLEVGAEEEIDVPTGTIRALPVRQLRKPGQESIEIWLAPERDYLPIRIRFLDRNGELSGEQLAADLAFVAR